MFLIWGILTPLMGLAGLILILVGLFRRKVEAAAPESGEAPDAKAPSHAEIAILSDILYMYLIGQIR